MKRQGDTFDGIEVPALHAEMRPITKVFDYPGNPRTHSSSQIQLLVSLIKKYGFYTPIVVDEGGVILAGHGRKAAAEIVGMEEVPVVIKRGLSQIEKSAMRISDNQSGLLSGWDPDLIRSELHTLQIARYEMPMLGFSDRQLVSFGIEPVTAGEVNPDILPEPPPAPVSKLGDVWHLGNHRLLVGDATAPANWKALMAKGPAAAMVFTDPPYGVSYAGGEFAVIAGDDKRQDDLLRLLAKTFRELTKHTQDTAAFYIWHASATREDFASAMRAAGLIERQYLIWVKLAPALGHADYQWQHEPCFYASKADQQSPAFYGDRAQSTVWHAKLAGPSDLSTTIGGGLAILDGEGHMLYVQGRSPRNKKLRQVRLSPGGRVLLASTGRAEGTVWEVGREAGGYEHPTQKPVELARRALENSSQPGEIVLDAFLGSGTTMIAAELTGRQCRAMELDPVYADVAVERWQKITERPATLGDTGRTFAKVKKARS